MPPTTTTTSSSIPSTTPTSTTANSSSQTTPTTMLTTTRPSSTSTTSNAVTSGYSSLGCYAEPAGARQWTRILANNSMSVELCLEVAQAHKPAYKYVGLEYGIECWAATTSFQYTAITTKACTMACSGSPSESCGGNNAFNFYTATATAS